MPKILSNGFLVACWRTIFLPNFVGRVLPLPYPKYAKKTATSGWAETRVTVINCCACSFIDCRHAITVSPSSSSTDQCVLGKQRRRQPSTFFGPYCFHVDQCNPTRCHDPWLPSIMEGAPRSTNGWKQRNTVRKTADTSNPAYRPQSIAVGSA